MAPPLRRGRALVLQRLTGLVFLAVLTGLVALSVGVYRDAFSPATTVLLRADRAGNQLTVGADVKARGVLVGEVREVRSGTTGAELVLALEPAAARRLPSDVRAQLLPKTLFGERYVSLVVDDRSTARPLREGDVVPQDRTATGRELSSALDSALPLLQALDPESVSRTLGAVSGALRGRGERVGGNLVLARDYLRGINPEVPTIGEDARGTADYADTLTASADDLVRVLDAASAVNRSLVDSRDDLDAFLRSGAQAARTARSFLAANGDRFAALPRESLPALGVYERYAPGYPCLLDAVERSLEQGPVFGGLQPGLHITAEFVEDQGGYLPGDEPLYGEDAGPTCFGLVGEPIRPFPVTVEVTDGYCDEQEEQPGVQTECRREPSGPALQRLLLAPLS